MKALLSETISECKSTVISVAKVSSSISDVVTDSKEMFSLNVHVSGLERLNKDIGADTQRRLRRLDCRMTKSLALAVSWTYHPNFAS